MWEHLGKVTIILGIIVPVIGLIIFFIRKYNYVKKLEKKIKHIEESGSISIQENYIDEVLPNAEIAKMKIVDLIQDSLANNSGRKLRIDNLGLDLGVAHTLFKYTFTEKFSGRAIDYRGLIIDPESNLIADVTGGNSDLSQKVAKRVIGELNESKISQEHLKGVKIEIRSYNSPPVMHGFIVDEEHLIMGFTHFLNDGLVGGGTSYMYIKKDKNIEFKKDIFMVYQTWFEYLWKIGRRQSLIQNGKIEKDA